MRIFEASIELGAAPRSRTAAGSSPVITIITAYCINNYLTPDAWPSSEARPVGDFTYWSAAGVLAVPVQSV